MALLVFDPRSRDRVRDAVLRLVQADERVVAGAVVGSLALTAGDRWSDLDLTFAVTDGTDLTTVLDDWQATLVADFGCTALFDLPAGDSLYRVFLFPGAIQVDLSVTPTRAFGPHGDTFRLLFGEANPSGPVTTRTVDTMFGYAVHHALRARVSIERGRVLQAEYWIGSLRAEVLGLACRRFGLNDWQARGAHELPVEVVGAVAAGLVRSLDAAELNRALAACIHALLAEGNPCQALADAVTDQLRVLAGGALPG